MTVGVGDPKPGRGSTICSNFFPRRTDGDWSRMESTAVKDARYDLTTLCIVCLFCVHLCMATIFIFTFFQAHFLNTGNFMIFACSLAFIECLYPSRYHSCFYLKESRVQKLSQTLGIFVAEICLLFFSESLQRWRINSPHIFIYTLYTEYKRLRASAWIGCCQIILI